MRGACDAPWRLRISNERTRSQRSVRAGHLCRLPQGRSNNGNPRKVVAISARAKLGLLAIGNAQSAFKKTACGCCGRVQMGWYDRKVRRVRDLSCDDTRIFLELEVRRIDCRYCGKVKRERLDFLADNPLYTKRFAYYVGRRCRSATIKDVAAELKLDWHTVKALEMQYMMAQLSRVGRPGPQVIGIDEIAIRKGHTYRIVVSDLLRGRPIWFGGKDRSEASMR